MKYKYSKVLKDCLHQTQSVGTDTDLRPVGGSHHQDLILGRPSQSVKLQQELSLESPGGFVLALRPLAEKTVWREIRSSGHQVIKSSGHRVIKSSGHQVIRS